MAINRTTPEDNRMQTMVREGVIKLSLSRWLRMAATVLSGALLSTWRRVSENSKKRRKSRVDEGRHLIDLCD